MQKGSMISATSMLAVCVLIASLSSAASVKQRTQVHTDTMSSSQTTGTMLASDPSGDAQKLVNEAVTVVKKMELDPQLVGLMKQAKGLYIVPEFGRGAAIVGARGGAGLVVVRQNSGWSHPAFYNFGAISLGAQAGGSGGSVVFLLMNQSAVDTFKSDNKFSLNTEAGFTIGNYSSNAQASWGKGDIIMWSDTAGAYIGATISVTDINWDDDNNQTYYGENVDMSKILQGDVSNTGADNLQGVLPG